MNSDEETPLIDGTPAPPSSSWRRAAALAVACGATIGAVAVTREPAPVANLKAAAASSRLSFSIASVEYPEAMPGRGYTHLQQSRLVEPNKDSIFSVSAARAGDELSGECAFSVRFLSGGGPWDAMTSVATRGRASAFSAKGTTSGAVFTTSVPAPGTYAVSLSCPMADGMVAEHEDTVTSSYVRRELRTLSHKDKEAFLDGFMVMYKTSTAAGNKRYGAHFRNIDHFAKLHLSAAGDRKVDHIHDGMGLLTQHSAMTMEFELSLQSIDASLSVPYWDYTMDSARVEADGKNRISDIFKNSELFTSEWFGATDSKEHTVTEGRFAYQAVSLVAETNKATTTHGPRGFLRAPWNLNPSKFVTRYHSLCGEDPRMDTDNTEQMGLEWPTCSSHFQLSAGAATNETVSWYHWVMSAGYLPHGPVHAWIGGVGGLCTTAFDELEAKGIIDAKQKKLLKHGSFGLLKNLWRDWLIEMPESCSPDASVAECTWTCKEDISSDHWAMVFLDMLNMSKSDQGPMDFKEIAHEVICDTTYWPGDHFEGASPIEASFWPIHPTLDRLFQYKDMTDPLKDLAWHNITGVMCQTSVNKTSAEVYKSDCLGHNAEDLTYWKSVKKDAATGAYSASYLTNIEVRDNSMPVTGDYALPYIYDHFEWDHCAELGVNFREVPEAIGNPGNM